VITQRFAMHAALGVSSVQQSMLVMHWNWQEPWRQMSPASPQSELRTHAGPALASTTVPASTIVLASTIVPESATGIVPASVTGTVPASDDGPELVTGTAQMWLMHKALGVSSVQQSMSARH